MRRHLHQCVCVDIVRLRFLEWRGQNQSYRGAQITNEPWFHERGQKEVTWVRIPCHWILSCILNNGKQATVFWVSIECGVFPMVVLVVSRCVLTRGFIMMPNAVPMSITLLMSSHFFFFLQRFSSLVLRKTCECYNLSLCAQKLTIFM